MRVDVRSYLSTRPYKTQHQKCISVVTNRNILYRTALGVMPPARLRRTPVPHGGSPQDRTGSPSRQERQENLESAVDVKNPTNINGFIFWGEVGLYLGNEDFLGVGLNFQPSQWRLELIAVPYPHYHPHR
jgi:hypothetical protein